MASKKQKERKDKKRKEIAKNRVLKRREYVRKQRKQAMEEMATEKKTEEKAFGKMKPFVKGEVDLDSSLIRTNDEEIRSKIEHNLKILEALEQEYDRESETRKEINQKLESEGFMTIKEKMDALHKKALELEGVAGQMEDAQREFDNGNKEIIVEAEVVDNRDELKDG